MPQVVDRKPTKFERARGIVFAGAAVLVVVGICVGIIVFNAHNDAQNHYNSIMAQAKNLDRQRQYSAEEKLLRQYLSTKPSAGYRYQVNMLLGNLAFNDGRDNEAVEDYKAAVLAEGGKPKLIDAQSIAQAAAAGGDNATAIEYYKQAIKLTAVKPGEGNDIAEFKTAIKNLGGTP